MNPVNWLIGQSRRPRGLAGRLLVRSMNRAHSSMTDWALSLTSLQELRAVLDVGCGGGGALLRLCDSRGMGQGMVLRDGSQTCRRYGGLSTYAGN